MRKKRILNIVMVLSVLVFCFSAFQLYRQTSDYRAGTKEYEQVVKEAVTIEEKDDKSSEKSYRVNFEKLKKMNPEVVGWIRFDEPENINYPLVQAKDNDKYLTTTFEGNQNKVGTIFVDYANDPRFEDSNTFIYGHNMKDGSMFGKLRNYRQESFWKDYPNFYIYTLEGQVHTYHIFSVEIAEDTSKSFQKQFSKEEEYGEYLTYIKEKALFDTGINVDTKSKIVSLSTCTNATETQRLVLHGVRIKTDEVK